MKGDEHEEEENLDPRSTLEPQVGASLADGLEAGIARGRELHQLQFAVIADGSECLGWQWPGGAEMPQRGSAAKAVHAPFGSNFVLCPHGTCCLLVEIARHRRNFAGNRRERSVRYRVGGMRWNRCLSESSRSARKSGCAIDASISARLRNGCPLRFTTPYSVATY